MENELPSHLINEIGIEIVALSEPGSRKTTMIFGQYGGGAAFGTDLYADHGRFISWIRTTDELTQLAMKLWYDAPADKKWAIFDCTVEHGHLSAQFLYPDHLLPGEDGLDAMHRIAKERFGNREIRYPPLPPGGKGASFEL